MIHFSLKCDLNCVKRVVRYNYNIERVEISHLLEPGEELCARLDGDALPLLLRRVVVLLP